MTVFTGRPTEPDPARAVIGPRLPGPPSGNGRARSRRARWPGERLEQRLRHERPFGRTFLIKGDEVTWWPAVDLNKVVLGAQIVAIVALFTIRAIVKVRAKSRV